MARHAKKIDKSHYKYYKKNHKKELEMAKYGLRWVLNATLGVRPDEAKPLRPETAFRGSYWRGEFVRAEPVAAEVVVPLSGERFLEPTAYRIVRRNRKGEWLGKPIVPSDSILHNASLVGSAVSDLSSKPVVERIQRIEALARKIKAGVCAAVVAIGGALIANKVTHGDTGLAIDMLQIGGFLGTASPAAPEADTVASTAEPIQAATSLAMTHVQGPSTVA